MSEKLLSRLDASDQLVTHLCRKNVAISGSILCLLFDEVGGVVMLHLLHKIYKLLWLIFLFLIHLESSTVTNDPGRCNTTNDYFTDFADFNLPSSTSNQRSQYVYINVLIFLSMPRGESGISQVPPHIAWPPHVLE